MFNKFFASCWNTSELPLSEEVHSIQSSFCELTVTPDEVFHLINALDINKANNPNNISTFILNTTTKPHSSSVLKLYIALVRPHLEYAAQVWKSHLAKDILSLERVQKFGLRICLRKYHTSYEYLLDFFKIPSKK